MFLIKRFSNTIKKFLNKQSFPATNALETELEENSVFFQSTTPSPVVPSAPLWLLNDYVSKAQESSPDEYPLSEIQSHNSQEMLPINHTSSSVTHFSPYPPNRDSSWLVQEIEDGVEDIIKASENSLRSAFKKFTKIFYSTKAQTQALNLALKQKNCTLASVKNYIEKNAKPDSISLSLAITHHQSYEIISSLIQYGAKANGEHLDLVLANHYDPAILTLFLNAGAQLNSGHFTSALLYNCNTHTLKFLLELDTKIKLNIEHLQLALVKQRPLQTIKLILDAGVKPNSASLRYALEYPHASRLTLLLIEKGAIPTLEDLHLALKHQCSFQVIQALINAGVKPTLTSLHLAINSENEPKILELLMAQGIQPDTKSLNSSLVEHKYNEEDIQELFLNRGVVPNSTSLNLAIYFHHEKFIEQFIKSGTPTNFISLSVARHDEKISKFLLENGTKPRNSDLENALYFKFSDDIIKLFIQYGAKPTSESLGLAIKNHYSKEIIALLLENGSRATFNDLKYAFEQDSNPDIIQLLMDSMIQYNNIPSINELNFFEKRFSDKSQYLEKSPPAVHTTTDSILPLEFMLQKCEPHLQIEKAIVQGAYVTKKCLTIALKNCFGLKTIELLLANGCHPDRSSLQLAIHNGYDIKVIQTLLDANKALSIDGKLIASARKNGCGSDVMAFLEEELKASSASGQFFPQATATTIATKNQHISTL